MKLRNQRKERDAEGCLGVGIVHRDLKLSNLLLDENLSIKIRDVDLTVRLKHHKSHEKQM